MPLLKGNFVIMGGGPPGGEGGSNVELAGRLLSVLFIANNYRTIKPKTPFAPKVHC